MSDYAADNFFAPDYPAWERYHEPDKTLVARVAFVDGPDGLFDYIVPENMASQLSVGARVQVPLGRGNRPTIAYCVELYTREKSQTPPTLTPSLPAPKPKSKSKSAKNLQGETLFSLLPQNSQAPPETSGKTKDANTDPATDAQVPRRLKEIRAIVDAKPLLSKKTLELGLWTAERYLAPIGTTLDAMTPTGAKDAVGTRLTSVCVLADDLDAKLQKLDAVRQKTQFELLTPKQRYALKALAETDEPPTLTELARLAKCSTAPISTLKSLGLIKMKRVKRQSRFYQETAALQKSAAPVKPHELNEDQRRALDQILDAVREGRSDTFLLHGVTGSGKTEVYIDAIEEVVSYGKQAIVLVPEISLTPQTVQRFCARLGKVAVLHSRLTDLERRIEWEKIAEGRANVVVGARSAILAPTQRLGLIVIDEEHETSFKQDICPRYHARVLAQYRARQENAPLILGSATPSLDSWHNAQRGAYKLLSLPRRVRDIQPPKVQSIDMRSRGAAGFTHGAFSLRLFREIESTLAADPANQVVLLLNRRGYATHIQCPHCGETLKCPECDVALTHHIAEQIALCHYCDYQIPAPKNCPYCGYAGIKYNGFGTQKLEAEFRGRFPEVPILRMDSDTTQAKDAHERAFDAFRRGEYRVLLGTQMIAKGLDFPNVVLVGVINADVALSLPDFRARERAFDLMLQAAGRAGRGEKLGQALIQSYNPEHPAIVATVNNDYEGFAQAELNERRATGYPPFAAMLRIVARGPDQAHTAAFINDLARVLREEARAMSAALNAVGSNETPSGLSYTRDAQGRVVASPRRGARVVARIVGPAPAPFAKLRGNYRFHLQLLGGSGKLLRQLTQRALQHDLAHARDVQWIVDVDPLDSL
ncbi:MAG: primosomal protein N' [Planctomycetia bacterium]|nr:primosomal protein N' [Planctomycetia bacterium]